MFKPLISNLESEFALCGAIFLALPQYNMGIIGVLLLAWLWKDTNCQSELKPVFIYTGVHMFTSCNIVSVSL